MNRVALAPCGDYAPENVVAAVREVLAPLGGIEAFVWPGAQVLLKPNLLAGKAPDKAVTTHPELLRAVIKAVRQAGGIPTVGDSPGIGTLRQVAKGCGVLAVLEEEKVELAPFTSPIEVAVDHGPFRRLELAADLFEADCIINLPKLKTHQMMGMTCGVKNLFGGVVGKRKIALHLQAGDDKTLFARLLLEIAERIAPCLTLVDAVTAMEGEGPGSGNPVAIGALLASRSPLAVDAAAIRLLGLPLSEVWTQQVALEDRRQEADPNRLEIVGHSPETFRPDRFEPARRTEIHFGLPRFLRRHLKRWVTARPEVDLPRCVACGLCVEHCPPQAMTLVHGRLHIHDAQCIRCFCCQELCPHNALKTTQGMLLKILSRSEPK